MAESNPERDSLWHLVYEWIIPLGFVAAGISGVVMVAGQREVGAEVGGAVGGGQTTLTGAPPRAAQAQSQAPAQGAALASTPGATVMGIRADRRDGRTVWKVRLSSRHRGAYEVDIDAGTGEVLPPPPSGPPHRAAPGAPG